MSEYADRDTIAMSDVYVKHVSAMTEEGLHAKSDIAAELAHRDIRIADLKRQLGEAQKELMSRDCYGEWCGKSPSKNDDGLCGACEWKRNAAITAEEEK